MTDLKKILLVEDQIEIQNLVSSCLRDTFDISSANTCEGALGRLQGADFDLILLDINLPDGNGMSLVPRIRENFEEIPIIFLTSNDSEDDVVLGFRVGADDYVIKPFRPRELKARIESKLRLREREQEKSRKITCGQLEIDLSHHKATINREDGPHRMDLTPLEFKLLCFLVENKGRVFSRAELIDKVWGSGISISYRSVDTQISGLRRKLKQLDYIKSIYGKGYFMSDSEKGRDQ